MHHTTNTCSAHKVGFSERLCVACSYSMARTLGSDPNQVAVAGRRTVVAWVSAAFTSQSLLQDITLGTDGGAGDVITLRQTFVPELTILRTGAPMAVLSTVSTTTAHPVLPPQLDFEQVLTELL